MPLYRYQCEACGHTFRVLQSLNGGEEAAMPPCENCGEESVRRVLPRVGVLYKGSGFYSTDYAQKGTENAHKESKD